MNDAYSKQMKLLLDVLPEVAKEACFAMHGGTAINLFVREMPRLSVDIDLTYVDIAQRDATLDGINAALMRIKGRIVDLRPSMRVQHKENVCKLLIDERGVMIKIEVNMVGRGLIGEGTKAPLCKAAQEQFDVFCAMLLVPLAQLYGGKICAALDRQHPRDLFDVKLLLDNEGFTDEIKRGFIFGLVSSNRPTFELFDPNLLDQRAAFDNQFEGMSAIGFSYDEFENTRIKLVETIQSGINDNDREFLLSLNRLEPNWSVYDFQKFPSVKWKLENLAKLKRNNVDKYQQQLNRLERLMAL